jgi:hypothetical protein
LEREKQFGSRRAVDSVLEEINEKKKEIRSLEKELGGRGQRGGGGWFGGWW